MKKFLVSLLAVAVVLSMAGVVLAADTGHAGHDYTKPGVKTPTTEIVKPISSGDIDVSSAPAEAGVTVRDTPATSADLVTALEKLENFSSNDIIIGAGEKVAASKTVTPVTLIPLTVTSSDKLPSPFIFTVSMDWDDTYMAFLRAHRTGSADVKGKSYDVTSGDWYGDPIVAFKKSGDKPTISIYTPTLFFSDNDVVIAKVAAPASSGSSSSGCNVGFAPMALLLGLPLFFLKK